MKRISKTVSNKASLYLILYAAKPVCHAPSTSQVLIIWQLINQIFIKQTR